MKTLETLTTQAQVITIGGYPISKLARVITHSGVFHADEVSTIALLEILAGRELDIIRTSKVDDTSSISMSFDGRITLTCDIGLGRYDHHQSDAEGKPYYDDGIPMAAIGLVARDIQINGKTLEDVYPGFTDEVLKPIEARDNGYTNENMKESPLGDVVRSFNPQWNSSRSADECFRKAIDITKMILDNFLSKISSRVAAEEVIKNATVINNVLVLDIFAPWQTYIGDDIVGCIFPSNRGGWNIQLAPGLFKFENRGKFIFDDYAKSLTTFVHPAGFLAATETKENAIELTKYIQPVNWKPAE